MLMKWIVVFIFRLRIMFSISDAASNYILKFLSVFLGLFGKIISPRNFVLANFKMPSSIYLMKQMLGGIKDFKRFVVCRKCSHVYELENCKDRNGLSKTCSFVCFPNHPQRRMRQPCGTILLKTVELTYCYLSIETSLQSMLLRPSFVMECSKWRTREVKSGVLQDIYDGALWKEFEVCDGVPFLSEPHNFAFTLNLDWFQPFKHSTYSIGAIYMTVMNLPRN